MNRPLLACECVECPSHAGERARLEAEVARLTALYEERGRLMTRMHDDHELCETALRAEMARLTARGDALAAAVEQWRAASTDLDRAITLIAAFNAARAWRAR